VTNNQTAEARPTSSDRRRLPRRRFLDLFLGSSVASLAAAILYPILRYISPPKLPEASTNRVLAAKAGELAKDGWKIFPFGSDAGILIETAPGQYRALAATCTHLECTVQFDKPTKRIWCACHNGWYDLDGRNVAGPPPKPLTHYTVQVEGEDIFVSRA
jgi:Rieske Fe-S protein